LILATLTFRLSTQLCRIKVEGHGGEGIPGKDPLCAAVSFAVRTLERSLSQISGLKMDAVSIGEGDFSLEVHFIPSEWLERFQGITTFFLTGLGDLEIEFPKAIKLNCKELEE